MAINQNQDRPPHSTTSRALRWISAIFLSGAGSVLAVRLATPPTLDDVLATLFLFSFLPGAAILVARLIRRPLGMALALAIPFAWTILSRDPSDSLALWVIPALALPLILLAGRRYRGGEGFDSRAPPSPSSLTRQHYTGSCRRPPKGLVPRLCSLGSTAPPGT